MTDGIVQKVIDNEIQAQQKASENTLSDKTDKIYRNYFKQVLENLKQELIAEIENAFQCKTEDDYFPYEWVKEQLIGNGESK